MQMINLMQRLAELDAKNPNIIKQQGVKEGLVDSETADSTIAYYNKLANTPGGANDAAGGDYAAFLRRADRPTPNSEIMSHWSDGFLQNFILAWGDQNDPNIRHARQLKARARQQGEMGNPDSMQSISNMNETLTGSYNFTDTISNPNFNPEDDDSMEEIEVDVGYIVHGSYTPARIKYDDYDHPAEDDREVELEVIDMSTGKNITDSILPQDRERLEARALEQAEEDKHNDFNEPYDDFDEPYEESVQDNLTLENIRMLSGIKTPIVECGPMGMVGQSTTPASLSITAASGPELSGMLRDIMQLAGMAHTSAEEPLSSEPVDHLEPVDDVQASPADSMRSVIDLLHPEDDEGDQEEVNEYDNEPNPQGTGYNSMYPKGTDMHSKGGEAPKVNGGGNPMQGTMEQIEKSLFAEYQRFLNEGS